MEGLLDFGDLPDQLQSTTVQGRVLILDADSLAYKASATRKTLKGAMTVFQEGVLSTMFHTDSESALIHLTHRDCVKAGRNNIIGVKPYQDNRSGSKRPELLHVVREACVEPENVLSEYQAWLHKTLEADDVCMIDSYKLKENGVLTSPDKDLRHTPYPFYDEYQAKIIQAKGVGSVWEHVTEGGHFKLHGIGRMFFWAQMLMGDTADNIGALQYYDGKRIGEVRTGDLLEPFNDTEDESEIANLVIDGYRAIDQNPYPEGYLLHMLRSWDDSFHKVVQELEWTKANAKFLEDCVTRKWFK